ncbi:MAG: hypothetical protein IPN20_17755 [Haliscomenobacter sp.]|nr:hypothetical protein [Haliscomenobacter sp.]MBP9872729.1 hypothetical protein [Haliscomenobacter sp.]
MRMFAITVLLVLFFVPVVAQEEQKEQTREELFENSPSQLVMSKGLRSNLSITLPDVKKKLIDRVWSNYTRSRFDSRAKYDRKAKEFIAAGAKVNAVAAYPVNLVSRSSQLGSGVQFHLWIDMQGAFLSREVSPRRMSDAYSILEDFAREVEREKVRLQVEEEEKNLNRLEGDLRQLKNANIRYHREIEFAEARIKKAKENIIKNEKDQVGAAQRIEAQLQALEAVKRLLAQL